jgi:predicted transcriptional regulator
MSNLSPADSLEKLRADLRHFEESSEFGENSTITQIKTHLLRRIADLESVLQRTNALDLAAPSVSPEHPIHRR